MKSPLLTTDCPRANNTGHGKARAAHTFVCRRHVHHSITAKTLSRKHPSAAGGVARARPPVLYWLCSDGRRRPSTTCSGRSIMSQLALTGGPALAAGLQQRVGSWPRAAANTEAILRGVL